MDVMRILLTYDLDIITGNMGNKACLNKTVKESVKKLLNEVVELDSKGPGSGNEKAAQRMPKGQSVVPMKQGDWNCPKYVENKLYLPCITYPHNYIYFS